MQDSLFHVRVEDITDDLILRRCRNLRDAVRLCRDCSPLSDDEILYELEKRTGRKLQKSHFSEALNGMNNRNFPLELIQELENICGNIIPTRYMALSRNFELKPKKEAWELENERLRKLLEEKEKELEIIRRWEKQKRGIAD